MRGYEDVLMPVHAVSLVAMGLWLLDKCDLEACATTAAELDQWDFHLAVAPVRFAGTSGDCVRGVREVIDAGAGTVLFTTLFDPAENMERLAAEVLPRLS
jgi:hypothetical protein